MKGCLHNSNATLTAGSTAHDYDDEHTGQMKTSAIAIQSRGQVALPTTQTMKHTGQMKGCQHNSHTALQVELSTTHMMNTRANEGLCYSHTVSRTGSTVHDYDDEHTGQIKGCQYNSHTAVSRFGLAVRR